MRLTLTLTVILAVPAGAQTVSQFGLQFGSQTISQLGPQIGSQNGSGSVSLLHCAPAQPPCAPGAAVCEAPQSPWTGLDLSLCTPFPGLRQDAPLLDEYREHVSRIVDICRIIPCPSIVIAEGPAVAHSPGSFDVLILQDM